MPAPSRSANVRERKRVILLYAQIAGISGGRIPRQKERAESSPLRVRVAWLTGQQAFRRGARGSGTEAGAAALPPVARRDRLRRVSTPRWRRALPGNERNHHGLTGLRCFCSAAANVTGSVAIGTDHKGHANYFPQLEAESPRRPCYFFFSSFTFTFSLSTVRLALPTRTADFTSGRDGLPSMRIPMGTKVTSRRSSFTFSEAWMARLIGYSKCAGLNLCCGSLRMPEPKSDRDPT